jgi:hypothetical protein
MTLAGLPLLQLPQAQQSPLLPVSQRQGRKHPYPQQVLLLEHQVQVRHLMGQQQVHLADLIVGPQSLHSRHLWAAAQTVALPLLQLVVAVQVLLLRLLLVLLIALPGHWGLAPKPSGRLQQHPLWMQAQRPAAATDCCQLAASRRLAEPAAAAAAVSELATAAVVAAASGPHAVATAPEAVAAAVQHEGAAPCCR